MEALALIAAVVLVGLVVLAAKKLKGEPRHAPLIEPRPPFEQRKPLPETTFTHKSAVLVAPTSAPPRLQVESPGSKILDANLAWLKARWQEATDRNADGDATGYAKWYFDPVTDRQVARIEADGFGLQTMPTTKGQASDIIGLLQPANESDAEVLRFFKVAPDLINQTRAPAETARLLADPISAQVWRSRPADAFLRECFRFYGLTIAKGLSHEEATRRIEDHETELRAQGSRLPDEMEYYAIVISELLNPATCADNGIRKPSLAVIRSAVKELREEGQPMSEIAGNVYVVVEKIIELKPALERNAF